MTRARLAGLTLLLGLGGLTLPVVLAARESTGTPVARAHVADGEAAAKAGKHADAAAAFRKAVEADPDFVDAHQRFIDSTRRSQAPASRTPGAGDLRQLYDGWATQHPKRAAYRWALGYLTHEPEKADVFFKQALQIDPAFARAHFSLAKNADLRGDWDAQRKHLQAAVDANPQDPQYLFRLAHAHRNSNPARFRELAMSVVQKFPDAPAAAEALYHLGNESSGPERRAFFDQVRATYLSDRFSYAQLTMDTLYSDLTEPGDALALARDMVTWLTTSKTWGRRVAHQETMVRVEALIAERKYADALDAIEKTERPSGNHATTWVLLKAEAGAGAGQLDRVYSTLLESVAAAPQDRVLAALVRHGARLNKAPKDIDADLWRIRDGKATPAPAFQLARSKDGTPVRLSDYRGRVVLVAFWFPG